MAGPRPGSNAYDIQRARLRKHLEDTGQAVDKDADEKANKILQKERGQEGILRSKRGLGPKGER